jgi:hypothetical protein
MPKKNDMTYGSKLELVLLLRAEEEKWKAGLDLGDLIHHDHKLYMKGCLDATQKAIDIALEIDSDKFFDFGD